MSSLVFIFHALALAESICSILVYYNHPVERPLKYGGSWAFLTFINLVGRVHLTNFVCLSIAHCCKTFLRTTVVSLW